MHHNSQAPEPDDRYGLGLPVGQSGRLDIRNASEHGNQPSIELACVRHALHDSAKDAPRSDAGPCCYSIAHASELYSILYRLSQMRWSHSPCLDLGLSSPSQQHWQRSRRLKGSLPLGYLTVVPFSHWDQSSSLLTKKNDGLCSVSGASSDTQSTDC